MRKDDFLPLAISLYFLTSFVSNSISQIMLGLALAAWLLRLIQNHEFPRFPGFFWALLGYAGLSLLASAFSDNPAVSFWDSRELLLLLVVPIVYMGISRPDRARWAAWALLASGLVSILYSLFYFIWKAAPGERIAGFMDHYMTQAGLLLLFSALALSHFLFAPGPFRWVWGGGFALTTAALILTLTRNAWVGFVVVTCVLLGLFKPKALILVPLAIGLLFAVSPGSIKRRALSIFDPRSYSNALRIEYLQAGLKIIRDHPVLGTGPNTVHVIFQHPRYGLSREARNNVHLHNNLLQIAAERGILTMLVWLGFLIWAFLSILRLVREKRASPLFVYAAAALAAIPAFFAAGLFEYNWGDSEVMTLLLGLITIPLGLMEKRKTRHEARP